MKQMEAQETPLEQSLKEACAESATLSSVKLPPLPAFCPAGLAACTPEELIRRAQEASPLALATLVYLAENPSVWPSVARQAACDILDRAMGKPVQQAVVRATHAFDVNAVIERLKAIALKTGDYTGMELLEQPQPEGEVEVIQE